MLTIVTFVSRNKLKTEENNCLKKAISLKTSKIKIWQLEPQFLRSSISAFNMMKR